MNGLSYFNKVFENFIYLICLKIFLKTIQRRCYLYIKALTKAILPVLLERIPEEGKCFSEFATVQLSS